MTAWKKVKTWLENYGFGGLVLLAIAGATVIGANVEVPEDLPNFALHSAPLYRVEVGAAVFLLFYLPLLAFVLALNGRGFTQIGPKGIKAERVVNEKQQLVLKGQEHSIEALKHSLARSTAATRLATERLNAEIKDLREQVERLEDQGS